MVKKRDCGTEMRGKLISSILTCSDFSIFCNRWIFSRSQPQFSFKFIRFNSLPHSKSLKTCKMEERTNMKKTELNKQWANQDCSIQASPNHGASSRAAIPEPAYCGGRMGLTSDWGKPRGKRTLQNQKLYPSDV